MSRKKKNKAPPPELRNYPQFHRLNEAGNLLNVYAVFLDGAGFQDFVEAPSDEEAIAYLREQYEGNEREEGEEILRGFRIMKLVDVARWGEKSGLRVV